ncbi:MAG: branched-chain amino acid ABC transporter permease [Chloroflexi bacterium]|nr:branched-chain amino acid ABC transporter permease [Chloroflexota bacterium]
MSARIAKLARGELIFPGALVALLVGWFLYMATTLELSLLTQVLLNGLVLALTYLLIAWGLTLMWGVMHLLNFAHGEFYMLGAFMVWYFMDGNDYLAGILGRPWNFLLATLFAIAVVGMLGILVEYFLFRPFGHDILPAFLISLGVGMMLQTGVLAAFGLQPKSIPVVFEGRRQLAGAFISNERLAMVVVALIVIVATSLFVLRTKAGRAMRAIRDDEEAAALQGINIGRHRSLVMLLGCALAAVAGAMAGAIYQVQPYMGVLPLSKAFAIIVLGGVGSLPGAVLGGFFIGFVESFGATLFGASVADMLSFLIIILALIFRPAGLLGRAR